MPENEKNYKEPAKSSDWMCDSCIVVFPGRENGKEEQKEEMHVGEYASSSSPLSTNLVEGVTIPAQDGGIKDYEELEK